MGKIVVTEFLSLDGVMEDPGGSEGTSFGGWAFEIGRGEEGDRFKLEETMRSEALLLGRVTYEGFAEAWPQRDGEFADKFNNMRHYVVSSSLQDPTWPNTVVIDGDLRAAVQRIKGEHEGDVVVHGSGQLAQALLSEGLVDQLNLMVYPVVLGEGKRLFASLAAKQKLALEDSRAVGDGVQILVYSRG
jgi:dihydrofolate reductase